MNYLPLILIVVFIAGLLYFSNKTRRRQALAEEQRREQIGVGAEVMTTSGLYGTVVAVNRDDTGGDPTVQLSIAPGIEVKWALAALRDLDSLPDRYRRSGGARRALGPDDVPGSISDSVPDSVPDSLTDLHKRVDPSDRRQGGDSAV